MIEIGELSKLATELAIVIVFVAYLYMRDKAVGNAVLKLTEAISKLSVLMNRMDARMQTAFGDEDEPANRNGRAA